uniref:Uncharacterized protein n=1 Tax=Arundo donax TaxID=35708 RepID=A0A0A8Y1B3_ARUDO
MSCMSRVGATNSAKPGFGSGRQHTRRPRPPTNMVALGNMMLVILLS